MKYFVRVGKAREPLELTLEDGRVTLDGKSHDVALAAVPGTPLYHLLLDGASWTFAVQPVDATHWILGVVGERIEVEAVDESTKRMQELAGHRPARSGPETIHAPMPGLIVRIPATQGQQVEPGTSLVVVEAMKMENELRAGHRGVVAEVHVRVGQTIEKGAALVTLTSFGEAERKT